MSEKERTGEDFLFSGIGADDESLSVFDQASTNNDGIYRPNLKNAKDKKVGYRATLRFLPNIDLEQGKKLPSAIEKHIHYVGLKNHPKLVGYYECRKNLEPNCELCTEFFRLYNSKNALENEKAELIKRNTKYYSYVLIIEDEQHPDLVGKVLVWPYGHQIKEKINIERNGEVSGQKCNVFDMVEGKDLRLIIKEKGNKKGENYQSYENSQFLDSSPIKLYNESKKEWREVPVEEVDGKILITNAKVRAKIKELYTQKEVNVYDHQPVEWTQDMEDKVEKIISILNGNIDVVAEQSAKTGGKSTSTTTNEAKNDFDDDGDDGDDFFNLDEDDE